MTTNGLTKNCHLWNRTVVGTGAVVGGGQIIDQQMGGPAKRQEVQLQEIRKVVREEVRSALEESMIYSI